MTGALLSSVRRFQFPVSSPVPVEGIQSCGAEGILESFALSIGNHADDLEHSGHVMHEPDAIQLSLLDGFRRTLAEREGFYCSTLKQRIGYPVLSSPRIYGRTGIHGIQHLIRGSLR